MAAAYVQKAANGSSAASTTIAVSTGSNVTAGNAISVFVRDSGATTWSCADSLGNTYTKIHEFQPVGGATITCFVAKNISGGACTITATSGTTFRKGICVREFSGLDLTTPEDQFDDAEGTDSTVEGPSITMTRDGVLLSGLDSSGQTITFDTDYAEGQQNGTGRLGDCHQIQAATTEGADHTLGANSQWATITWNLMEPAGGAAAQMFLLTPIRTDGVGHGGIFPGGRL